MGQSSEAKWLKLTNHGEWATHTVSVKVGRCRGLGIWQQAAGKYLR